MGAWLEPGHRSSAPQAVVLVLVVGDPDDGVQARTGMDMDGDRDLDGMRLDPCLGQKPLYAVAPRRFASPLTLHPSIPPPAITTSSDMASIFLIWHPPPLSVLLSPPSPFPTFPMRMDARATISAPLSPFPPLPPSLIASSAAQKMGHDPLFFLAMTPHFPVLTAAAASNSALSALRWPSSFLFRWEEAGCCQRLSSPYSLDPLGLALLHSKR